jgi:hypothetical protein
MSQLSDNALSELVLMGEALGRSIEARCRELLAEFDRRATWQADGATSAANWVAARTGRRRSVVRRQVALARSIAAAPAVAAVAARLSADHLRLLASCRCDTTLEAYVRDERLLIEHALTLTADDFSEVVQAWRVLADPDGSAGQRRHDAQTARVHLSRTLDGWWVLSGLLPPEEGEHLHVALEAGVNRRLRAAHDGDPAVVGRPVASWRAEALVDLAAQSMRRQPSDQSVPDRYRIGLLVRPEDLGQAPSTALCDSSVYRLVVGAKSETLDVGRSTPVWPVGLRRAITARDGGCVFPGCDRPPSWCDVHHCRPWSEGGDTCLDNGALLCRMHHTFAHRDGWTVIIPAARGTPEVHRPDGSLFILRRSDPGRAAAA